MEMLALCGGSKSVTLDYESVANLPVVSEKSVEAVNKLLEKSEISMSSTVKEFETRFAAYIGADYGLALNNGTASLHTALFAAGVCQGDEVLVPSYTFWATVVPIVSAHGTPVFCDVDPKTFCMDPSDMEKRITSKTKAIMVVHVWGNPCDMDAVMALAKKHGLKVIEDCSHAHGAMYKGKKVGSIGDIGCFSLQGSKLLTAGEGGILVTSDRECYERAMAFGHYERLENLPEDSGYKKYVLTGMGHKYRAHPLGIAIANTELDILDQRNATRNRWGKELENKIADLDYIIPQECYSGAEREYAYQYCRFDNEKLGGVSTYTLLKALHAEGVVCGYCGYGRLHYAPFFTEGGAYGDCGPHDAGLSLLVTEALGRETLMIAPRFEKDCPELVEQYANAYHKIANNVQALVEYEKANGHQDSLNTLSGRSISIFK